MSITTSTISHEMRNPLNSIISQCQIQLNNIADLENLLKSISHKLTGAEMEEANRIKKNME